MNFSRQRAERLERQWHRRSGRRRVERDLGMDGLPPRHHGYSGRSYVAMDNFHAQMGTRLEYSSRSSPM